MTAELSIQELQAEIERRQREEVAEQQRRASVLQEAQIDWSRALLKSHKAREQELEEAGSAAMKAGEQAVRGGDLAAAFQGYTTWHASRMARYHLRSAAQSAINRVPDYRGSNIPDLRIVDVTFHEWLNEQCSKLATSNGADLYEQTVGAEIPTSYEEAAAWMEANRGN
ncbi:MULTISPECIES: hypothetical protein [unclassified Arthrobacter]|uniref:hypothetical protein n=1 Tax=unclassified Arthrobacter TaxID=235627 RepID=UPI001C84D1A1|nr:hypothetical protein [Arthrobacter sp. MAHUQ-56]MBX7445460.1 hypothetical protein [Arthrobacter sp. MAHUQ-56]